MLSNRDAVLTGALEAARLHEDLDTQSSIDLLGGRVDPFDAILQRGADLLFRQLDGLLGAYLPKPRAGILVTTERSLAIQRYTAAHELGHFVMGHRASIDDDEILQRFPSRNAGYDPQEVAADAFGAAFLLPAWIIEYHAARQGWTAADLADPINVYQLSLRVGVSYDATCRTLLQHYIVTEDTAKDLLDAWQPKKIKQRILGKKALQQWYPNVWLLTERDQGAAIHGEPGDLFVVRLTEHAGSGYLWDLNQVEAAGFKVITDERRSRSDAREEIGGSIDRIVTAQSDGASIGNLDLQEIRPWDTSDIYGRLSFAYDLRGREHGLPRAARERLRAA
jgi:Zn-dependent peptidase ImmA (M78 family)/predicted secreted protein